MGWNGSSMILPETQVSFIFFLCCLQFVVSFINCKVAVGAPSISSKFQAAGEIGKDKGAHAFNLSPFFSEVFTKQLLFIISWAPANCQKFDKLVLQLGTLMFHIKQGLFLKGEQEGGCWKATFRFCHRKWRQTHLLEVEMISPHKSVQQNAWYLGSTQRVIISHNRQLLSNIKQ